MLLELMEWLIRNLCHMTPHAWWVDRMPPVWGWLASLPTRKVTKSEAHVDPAHAGKVKTTQGYVWVETDRERQFANKLGSSVSCHKLTGGSAWRAGNANYVACPFFAMIAAGRNHPTTEDGYGSIFDPEVGDYRPLRTPPTNALANLFLMVGRTPEGAMAPYLFMSRLYDSQNVDYPWDRAMIAYLVDHCRDSGVGLAISPNGDSCRGEIAEGATTHDRGKVTNRLRTPRFDAPGEYAYEWYADAGLSLRRASGPAGGWFYQVGGVILIDPQPGVWEAHIDPTLVIDPDPYDHGIRVTCYEGGQEEDPQPEEEEDEEEPYAHCDRCGADIADEEDAYNAPGGDSTICEDCWERHTSRCERCEESCWENDLVGVRVGRRGDSESWCEYCASDHSLECENCNELHELGVMDVWQDQDICEGCLDSMTHPCDHCGARVDVDEEPRRIDYPDGSVSPPVCKNCHRDSLAGIVVSYVSLIPSPYQMEIAYHG